MEELVLGRHPVGGDLPCLSPEPEHARTRQLPERDEPRGEKALMEFLNFLIILLAGWMVWRRPKKETLAFGLLMASCVLMALLFLIGTHGSLVPGVNL